MTYDFQFFDLKNWKQNSFFNLWLLQFQQIWYSLVCTVPWWCWNQHSRQNHWQKCFKSLPTRHCFDAISAASSMHCLANRFPPSNSCKFAKPPTFQVVAHKRDVIAQPFVTHLTPNLRIRVNHWRIDTNLYFPQLAKKGFSLARKKSKSDIFVEPEVRVCPAEVNGGGGEMSDV